MSDEQNETTPEETPVEAPEPTEAAPVEVSPEPTPGAKADTVLGKDYEVTPERGYRRTV